MGLGRTHKVQEKIKTEIWKDIEGYEGYYQVSDLGRVKSLERKHPSVRGGYYTRKEHLVKQLDNGHGYLYVRLNLNGICKHHYVHRLVALAFLPKNELNEINHKNEDKTDNTACNLEWCTHKYNANFGTRQKRTIHTKELNQSNLRMIETRNRIGSYGAEKPVLKIGMNGVVIERYNSVSSAARKNKLSPSHICMCCKQQRKSHGNYQWRYENEIQ